MVHACFRVHGPLVPPRMRVDPRNGIPMSTGASQDRTGPMDIRRSELARTAHAFQLRGFAYSAEHHVGESTDMRR